MATVNLTLTIPDALVPRILAAVRGTYPDITAGLTDGQAYKAALRLWTTQCLAGYEASLAGTNAFAQAQAARQAASDAATSDASAIT